MGASVEPARKPRGRGPCQLPRSRRALAKAHSYPWPIFMHDLLVCIDHPANPGRNQPSLESLNPCRRLRASKRLVPKPCTRAQVVTRLVESTWQTPLSTKRPRLTDNDAKDVRGGSRKRKQRKLGEERETEKETSIHPPLPSQCSQPLISIGSKVQSTLEGEDVLPFLPFRLQWTCSTCTTCPAVP